WYGPHLNCYFLLDLNANCCLESLPSSFLFANGASLNLPARRMYLVLQKYSGTDLYSRNLKLLVPFFDDPSIRLQSIEKFHIHCCRTYLRLPWRPLVSIDGVTVYELNEDFQIVRHTESWNVSALEAMGQIFTPSFDSRITD
ncbi:hypothetical protein LINPERHAP2_LOCUS38243, partial [Linum perenne]